MLKPEVWCRVLFAFPWTVSGACVDKSQRAATNAAGGVCFSDQAFEFWPVDREMSDLDLHVQVRPSHVHDVFSAG